MKCEGDHCLVQICCSGYCFRPEPSRKLCIFRYRSGSSRVEVRRVTRRVKDQSKIRDLFAGERCSQAALDFLSTTDM